MLVLNYELIWATMLLTGIAASTPIEKYFNIIPLLFLSSISMISAFTIGISAYDLTFISNGAAVAATDNAVGYLWTGFGLLMLLRLISLVLVLFTESVNRNSI